MVKRISLNQGATLIEVMVALCLVSLSAYCLVLSMLSSLRFSRTLLEESLALDLQFNQAEQDLLYRHDRFASNS